ncbi:MAG: transcription antitermination factor NusB, partial [Vicinamibacterales bacterium]
MSKVDATGLRHARGAALQMLYQMEVGRVSLPEAIRTYWAARDANRLAPPPPDDEESTAEIDPDLPEPLRAFADRLAEGTMARVTEIDSLLGAHAQNWRVERMAVLDRLVLRLAVYEMLSAPDTPARVVINEALELT